MTIAIGDIHGGLRALEELLHKIPLTTNDRLIFLGDYVDGWSENAQVIDKLLLLKDQYDCTFINGNHDDWCREWLEGETPDEVWLEHGGKATIKSYEGYSKKELSAHLHFFQQLKAYHLDDENRLFIHAGFTAMNGVSRERNTDNFARDRTLWEVARVIDPLMDRHDRKYPKRLTNYAEIFIGHTPTLYSGSSKPMHGASVWNLDTGAAFTGPLTAMDIDSKTFWQSEAVYKLYPDEIGRNRR